MEERSGDRSTLVRWQRTQARELVAIANDAEVARYLTPSFPHPYTLADARDWIESVRDESPTHHFAILAESRLAGSIGITLGTSGEAGTAFVGYFLGRAFWGRGVATDAVRSITAYAFEFPEVARAWANVYAPNVASMRVLEKAGYQREAILRSAFVDRTGTRHDKHVFALLRDER